MLVSTVLRYRNRESTAGGRNKPHGNAINERCRCPDASTAQYQTVIGNDVGRIRLLVDDSTVVQISQSKRGISCRVGSRVGSRLKTVRQFLLQTSDTAATQELQLAVVSMPRVCSTETPLLSSACVPMRLHLLPGEVPDSVVCLYWSSGSCPSKALPRSGCTPSLVCCSSSASALDLCSRRSRRLHTLTTRARTRDGTHDDIERDWLALVRQAVDSVTTATLLSMSTSLVCAHRSISRRCGRSRRIVCVEQPRRLDRETKPLPDTKVRKSTAGRIGGADIAAPAQRCSAISTTRT